jgi:hypothetical protein
MLGVVSAMDGYSPSSGSPKDVFARIAAARTSLLILVATAVVLAVAVNLVSGWLADAVSPSTAGLIGLAMLLLLGALAISRLRIRTDHVFNAFLVFDRAGAVLSVPRYSFAESMDHVLQLSLHGSAELWQAWTKQRNVVVVEATEFFVLNALANHLSRYAKDARLYPEGLKPLTKADLGASNRILELLGDLESFPVDKGDFEGTLEAFVLPGDTVIQDYSLTLPKGSTVARADDGVLVLSTKLFCLSLAVSQPDDSSFLPAGFVSEYLGSVDASPEPLRIDIGVRVRPRAFLAGRGLRYYRWVDSFAAELQQRMDAVSFLDRIGWEQAQTAISAFRGVNAALPGRSGDDPRPTIKRIVEVLSDAGLPVEVSEDGAQIRIRRGSSETVGELQEIAGELALHLVAPVLVDIDDDGSRTAQVLERVNNLALRVPLVRFAYDQEQHALLMLYDVFLGALRPEDLVAAVHRTTSVADDLDDKLQAELGTGRLAAERGATSDLSDLVAEVLAFAQRDDDGRLKLRRVNTVQGTRVLMPVDVSGAPLTFWASPSSDADAGAFRDERDNVLMGVVADPAGDFMLSSVDRNLRPLVPPSRHQPPNREALYDVDGGPWPVVEPKAPSAARGRFPELSRKFDRAMALGAACEGGDYLTARVRAADGDWADLIVDDDGSMVVTEADIHAFNIGSEVKSGSDRIAFMRHDGGYSAVVLNADGVPVHGSGASVAGSANQAATPEPAR